MHPQAEQKSIFKEIWEIWTVGVVNLVVLASVLRATTIKRSSTFGGRKVHPEKILATPMPETNRATSQLARSNAHLYDCCITVSNRLTIGVVH